MLSLVTILRVQKHLVVIQSAAGKVRRPLSVFGTDIHPDLAKLQCEQGALFSYREAQSNRS